MTHEIPFDMRAMIRLGIIQSVDDTGPAQTITVKTDDGFTRGDIEVLQPFGIASNPPVDGGLALLLAVGGDPAHYVALPLANPAARFGKQQPGETAIYEHNGTRVHLRAGGIVDVKAATQVNVAAGTKVIITAATEVDFDVPEVNMSGNLNVAGDVSDGHGKLSQLRSDYNLHRHGGTTTTTDHPD